MTRVTLPDLGNVEGPLGEALRARPPANLYRVLALAPTVAPGFLHYGLAVLRDMQLDPGLRELAILRVAHRSGSAYEIAHHRPMARKAGLTPSKIEGVLSEVLPDEFTDVEKAVIRFVDEVVANVKASPLAFEAVASHLSQQELVELLLTIGQYMGIARLLENLEIEVDAFVLNAE